MSFDLLVTVPRPVGETGLRAALLELGAPCTVECEPQHFDGYVNVQIELRGVRLYKTGFEGSVSSNGDSTEYGLSLHGNDDLGAGWAVAAGLMVGGGGSIFDAQSGKSYHASKTAKVLAMVTKWTSSLEKIYAKLSDEDKAFRSRHVGETFERFEERLFFYEASDDERVARLKEKMSQALASGDDDEAIRIAALAPTTLQFVEPVLDPCFRAMRVDLGRRVGVHFGDALLRAHFLEAVRWVGVGAVPYVQFLADVTHVTTEAETLRLAHHAASDATMRAALPSIADLTKSNG